jgi:hypothetical protein
VQGVGWQTAVSVLIKEINNARYLRYRIVVMKTCRSQFNWFFFSQEENDDAKKLKEARLAAYTAKKAKSKYSDINI